MAELVETTEQLKTKVDYFERSASSHSRDYRDFLQRGTCFVAYTDRGETHFAPSRFLGYRDNSFEDHAKNENKNGRETNPVISRLLGSQPAKHEELEEEYRRFCHRLEVEVRPKGSFGVERKFWDWR